MQADLSIVIVNWNTAPLVLDCLRSLYTPPPAISIEVIVVDNGSSDDSAARIEAQWPQVGLIRNPGNRGYAAANNQGIALAASRHVLLLNSDTLMAPGALAGLVQFMDQHPEAAACSPRLLDSEGRAQEFAFGCDPTPLYLVRRRLTAVFGRSLHDWETGRVQSVDWVSGACLIARRAAIEQTGPLDEAMFMYFEDNDWCLRFRERGWKVYYDPEISITHLGGQSVQRSAQASHAYRASLRHFYRKHYGRLAQAWLGAALPLYRGLAKR
ncbi:MAG: glycosyltransferase family 2 protein [Candidatus Eiseniibacteriota bacterium]